MTPAFSSWSDFFAMGGYAFFVWLAVAATVTPLCILVIHTRWQRRLLLTEIQRREDREIRIKQSKQQQQEVAP